VFRIYYHLYCGASWREVWALHQPVLEQFAASGLLEKLVICVCGAPQDLGISPAHNLEIRQLSHALRDVNEFHTLRELHRDARDAAQSFSYCVYFHSKGASSQQLSGGAVEWSSFLARALLGSLPAFEPLVALGYNSLGSNLALGIFEDFGAPRLHYSGNFWCATRELVAAAPEITLGTRYTAVRHNAEWWLERASAFTPCNVFSTGLDHYAAPAGLVDWARLESRLGQLAALTGPARHAMEAIRFQRAMMQRATGHQPLRQWLSKALLRVLPHHRWRRLLNVHHVMMRTLGSRKSTYLYCAES
jgi:hypothetical protein